MSGLIDPAEKSFIITPDDNANLAKITRGIFVGVAGDVALMLVGDSASVVFKAMAAGVVHPLQVKKVLSTDTTATDIIGVY